MPFRRALSKEDQKAFDRKFAYVTQPLRVEVWLGRPSGFEAVLMVELLEHEQRVKQRFKQLDGEQSYEGR